MSGNRSQDENYKTMFFFQARRVGSWGHRPLWTPLECLRLSSSSPSSFLLWCCVFVSLRLLLLLGHRSSRAVVCICEARLMLKSLDRTISPVDYETRTELTLCFSPKTRRSTRGSQKMFAASQSVLGPGSTPVDIFRGLWWGRRGWRISWDGATGTGCMFRCCRAWHTSHFIVH